MIKLEAEGPEGPEAIDALVALVESGVRLEDAVAGLAACPGVPGRLERVPAPGLDITAFVDYSHKPGAVEAVLRSLRPVTRGNLIIVLGCGGDRDRAKRPMMGAAAASLLLLLIGIHNAWDLAVWMTLRKQDDPDAPRAPGTTIED